MKIRPATGLASIFVAVLCAASNTLAQQKRVSTTPVPSQVQFESGRRAVVPFVFEDNSIVVQVRVNNSSPMKFFFDTGAGISALNVNKAAGLNLKKADSLNANGVGGSIQGYLARGAS